MLFNMVYLKVNSVYFCLGVRAIIGKQDRNNSEPVDFIYYKHMVKRFADRPCHINAMLVCLKFLQEKQFSL